MIIGKLDKNKVDHDESDNITGHSDNIWRDLLFDENNNIIGWVDGDGTMTKLNK